MPLKSWWSKSSPTVRRGLRGILIALVLSFIVICVVYSLLLWLLPSGSVRLTPPRLVAFVDSLLSGIVAFAMVGAFAFVASLRKPEEDKIDERIAYLYSARLDENHATKLYLTEQLMLLGASIKESETLYNFLELDKNGDAVRVNVRISMTIVNMMKRDVYKQHMPIRVSFDPVDSHNDHIGTILRVETTPCRDDGTYGYKTSHLAQSMPIAKNKSNEKFLYEDKVELQIPPNGELRYEYEYEGWVRAKDNFWSGVNRFAEKLSIKVVNLSGTQLRVSPNQAPSRPKYLNVKETFDLKPDESATICVANAVTPDRPITFSTEFLGVDSATHTGGTPMYRDNDTQGG